MAGDWRGHDWAGGDKKLVKFVLLKENMDTQVGPVRTIRFDTATQWHKTVCIVVATTIGPDIMHQARADRS